MVISQVLFSWVRRPTIAAVVLTAGLAISTAIGWVPGCSAKEVFVSIGTGELDGVYYPVVKAICTIIAPDLQAQRIWCSPETTPGSVYNVDAVQSGELEFGIVQSDVLYAADRGIGAWNGKPVSNLRSVLSLYPELVTVIARASANIHDLTDLRASGSMSVPGKAARGPPGTPSRQD
jgi:TRAP transporter TAXI family solute receptor